MKFRGVAGKLLVAALCGYLGACIGACVWQRQVLYHPVRAIATPATYDLDSFEDVHLTDQDGTQIDSWVRQASGGYPTILFFHGNSGNLSYHKHFLKAIAEAGFGVIAVDYRGYGASEGEASEGGLYQDARAALLYAVNTAHVKPDRIILYGESLGTGVAVEMASETNVAAVVLQSPFTTLEDLGKDRFSWLPIHYLLFDRFDSLEKIGRVHAPLLILHGRQDTIVPLHYGEQLFAKANEPKEFIYFPDAGHNDMPIPGRLNALTAFAGKYGLIRH